jgi:hypothetical protein
MPMKHLGFYEFRKHYSLVNYKTGTIREPSYYGLIKDSGLFFIQPALYELMNEIGSLIIGQDSIINGWAEFTSQAARRAEGVQPVPKEKILTVLTKAVDVPRDITQVKRILKSSDKEKFTVSGRESACRTGTTSTMRYRSACGRTTTCGTWCR